MSASIRRSANDPNAKVARKTYTFAGGAGAGDAGTVTFFTLTGSVRIKSITAVCSTDLTTSGAATMSLGVTGSAGLFIAATLCTALDAGTIWQTATPTAAGLIQAAIAKDTIISASIIGTIGIANVTGGAIDFLVEYVPISSNGALA